MKAYADRGQLSGIVTLVMHQGEIAHLNATGLQTIEDKKPMAPDSIFQVMSMTKPVTGVAIMMLAEEGKFSLQDPVEMHLPEFKGQMVKASDGSLQKPPRLVTIRDLMSHTSGMPGMPPASTPDLYQKMNLTLEEAVRVFAQQPLEFNPGTRWMYSNPGIATLGRLVEVHSGMPFERFLDERIFKPLGMKDSHIFLPAEKHGRLALVYRVGAGGKLERAPGNSYGGDAGSFRKGAKFSAPEYGLYTTAADLGRFYQMMLNGGVLKGQRLLSKASVDTMSALHTGALKAGHNPGTGFGLTWEVVKEPGGMLTMRSIGSYGHGGAYGTHGWIDPAKNLVGVFLIQSAGGGAGGEARDAFMTMAGSAVLD
jgi:CubicO group peptidase (beta-lactamase class C family)